MSPQVETVRAMLRCVGQHGVHPRTRASFVPAVNVGTWSWRAKGTGSAHQPIRPLVKEEFVEQYNCSKYTIPASEWGPLESTDRLWELMQATIELWHDDHPIRNWPPPTSKGLAELVFAWEQLLASVVVDEYLGIYLAGVTPLGKGRWMYGWTISFTYTDWERTWPMEDQTLDDSPPQGDDVNWDDPVPDDFEMDGGEEAELVDPDSYGTGWIYVEEDGSYTPAASPVADTEPLVVSTEEDEDDWEFEDGYTKSDDESSSEDVPDTDDDDAPEGDPPEDEEKSTESNGESEDDGIWAWSEWRMPFVDYTASTPIIGTNTMLVTAVSTMYSWAVFR